MGLLLDEIMRPINAINDTVDTISTLAEMAPLLGEQGVDFFSHAIMLLNLIEVYAKRLGGEMDVLVEVLRSCHDQAG